MNYAILRASYLGYGSPYGVASSQCASIDAQIAALQSQKPSMWKTDGSYKAWKKQMDALKDAKKMCSGGSPTLDTPLLPQVDLSTTSSALPVLAVAALGGIAVIMRKRSTVKQNPRRNRRRRR